jgi:7-keto-8-aminopelargonate synthetase-like enzyme
MDESISFGTIGKTGRGVTEFYNIDVNESLALGTPPTHYVFLGQ